MAARRIASSGERFGLDIDPEARSAAVGGWQQRVEILKALYREARILVLDEPTAVLTPQETKEIFGPPTLRTRATHHLHQPQALRGPGDRRPHHGHPARQGRGRRLPTETNEDDLAELMVGREVQLTVDRGDRQPG